MLVNNLVKYISLKFYKNACFSFSQNNNIKMLLKILILYYFPNYINKIPLAKFYRNK